MPSDCESFNGDIVPLLVGQKNASGGFSHHFSMHSIALDKNQIMYNREFFRIINNPILIIHIRNGIMPHLWGKNLSHIYAREVR